MKKEKPVITFSSCIIFPFGCRNKKDFEGERRKGDVAWLLASKRTNMDAKKKKIVLTRLKEMRRLVCVCVKI